MELSFYKKWKKIKSWNDNHEIVMFEEWFTTQKSQFAVLFPKNNYCYVWATIIMKGLFIWLFLETFMHFMTIFTHWFFILNLEEKKLVTFFAVQYNPSLILSYLHTFSENSTHLFLMDKKKKKKSILSAKKHYILIFFWVSTGLL